MGSRQAGELDKDKEMKQWQKEMYERQHRVRPITTTPTDAQYGSTVQVVKCLEELPQLQLPHIPMQ